MLGSKTTRQCLCSELQASSESAPHPKDLPFGIFDIWHFFRDELPVLLLVLPFKAPIQLFRSTVKSKLDLLTAFSRTSPRGDWWQPWMGPSFIFLQPSRLLMLLPVCLLKGFGGYPRTAESLDTGLNTIPWWPWPRPFPEHQPMRKMDYRLGPPGLEWLLLIP